MCLSGLIVISECHFEAQSSVILVLPKCYPSHYLSSHLLLAPATPDIPATNPQPKKGNKKSVENNESRERGDKHKIKSRSEAHHFYGVDCVPVTTPLYWHMID